MPESCYYVSMNKHVIISPICTKYLGLLACFQDSSSSTRCVYAWLAWRKLYYYVKLSFYIFFFTNEAPEDFNYRQDHFFVSVCWQCFGSVESFQYTICRISLEASLQTQMSSESFWPCYTLCS